MHVVVSNEDMGSMGLTNETTAESTKLQPPSIRRLLMCRLVGQFHRYVANVSKWLITVHIIAYYCSLHRPLIIMNDS